MRSACRRYRASALRDVEVRTLILPERNRLTTQCGTRLCIYALHMRSPRCRLRRRHRIGKPHGDAYCMLAAPARQLFEISYYTVDEVCNRLARSVVIRREGF